MRQISILILMVLIMLGCASRRETTNAIYVMNDLPSSVNYSAPFRLFWHDMTEEMKGAKSLDSYAPSDELKSKYNLQDENGVTRVSGFLQVDSSFNASHVDLVDCRLQGLTSTQYTYSVSLANLLKMLNQPGIYMVDISQRVYLRPR